MDEYKKKLVKIKNIIEKTDNLINILKENNLIDKKDLHIFLQNKENFNFSNQLIIYFYNLYYMNSYEYLNSLNNLIDIKTKYLST